MGDFLLDYYLWIKALHILAVIAWMAGLLMLPRYFVYHAQVDPASDTAKTLTIMERKLLKIILTPSMVLTWLFGGMLALTPGLVSASSGWFHVKLLAVVILSGLHGFFSKTAKKFAAGENRRDQKFYRMINEIPFVLAIVIVLMVVLKPF